MSGRTVSKHVRVYAGGYDVSGYSREIGPLLWEFEPAEVVTFADAVKGALPNHCIVNPGTLNGVMDATATVGLHVIASTVARRIITVAIGDRAAPAAGVPVYCGEFNQMAYQAAGDGIVTVTAPFSFAVDGTTLVYPKPWGVLLHALGAETGASTATGFDNESGGATTFGGFFVYHVTAGDGTATLSVDDSADNAAFSALGGATSGSIDFSTRTSGLVALSRQATVRRYLRFQIALGTATTVTFVSSFVRMFW